MLRSCRYRTSSIAINAVHLRLYRVLTGADERLNTQRPLDRLEKLNDILPINNVLLKSRSTTAVIPCAQPPGGQVVRPPRRGLLCRAQDRWQAVGGAGLLV